MSLTGIRRYQARCRISMCHHKPMFSPPPGINHRLIMALPDLFSCFDFQFKNGMAVPPFTGNCHTAALCTIMIIDRHLISTYRARHPAAHFLLFFIHSLIPIPPMTCRSEGHLPERSDAVPLPLTEEAHTAFSCVCKMPSFPLVPCQAPLPCTP